MEQNNNKSLLYKIDTNPEKYFHQLIEILKVFPPFSSLRKRQREVFAEILHQFYLYNSESEEIRSRIVFDYRAKRDIAKKLNITKGNLYNIYKELRQNNLLTKDGINKRYLYKYLQFEGITFKFQQERSTEESLSGVEEPDSKLDNKSS